jgi:nucleoside-diphosphate-sugar epimerase
MSASRPSTPRLTDWSALHGEHFRGQRVLITGGAGFIGSHLAEALLTLGARITVIDDLAGGSLENLKAIPGGESVQFFQASILDAAALHKAVEGSRYVFHQAALGSVPKSIEQPVEYQLANADGTLMVLESARKHGVRRVMFAASSSAYGDSPTLPKIETMPALPKSPYAATKVAGEALCRAYAGSYGLDTAALRYFNIFGPRQSPDNAYAAVIAAFAKALAVGKHPVIYGDGEQSRDFTFVHNVVHANLLAARHVEPIDGEVINIACGTRITVTELAKEMAALFGRPDLNAEYRPERAGDVKHSVADLQRAEQILGYRPIVDFRTGLAAAVEWYRKVLASH